jgi:hypothetical protein
MKAVNYEQEAYIYYYDNFTHACFCGPGSSIGIATGYGLDDPGIESRWRQDFSALVQTGPGPTQPPLQWVPGLSQG